MLYKTDIAVLGGGAAGLCAAVQMKQLNPRFSVTVFEQLDRVGKKLSTTGNGRCNITNNDLSPARFHGKDPKFSQPLLQKYGGKETADFFESIGILFQFDETGRGYPASLQASSVVDALRFSAEENGVRLKTGCRVENLIPQSGGFVLTLPDEKCFARAVLVTTGLYSGGDKVGSDGKMFRFFKQMGYPTEPVTPAIVQLKTPPESVRALKGVKINGRATLLRNGKALRTESGEILFCDYGLSGPPILQLARPVEREKGNYSIELDLLPAYSEQEIRAILQNRVKQLGNRPAGEFFTGLLQKRVGQVLIKSVGVSFDSPSSCLDRAKLDRLCEWIKSWQFTVTGTTGFLHSQVTAGGLSTESFDANTLASKRHQGLFAAGEILDVDGDCGGFNLQWAWSSGLAAAEAVIRYLEGTVC